MGVVAARRSEVREVGAEIQAAATTTVARVDHMQIAGPVQQDAAQVMQSAAAEVVAVAAAATGWAGSPLIVACAGDDQGAGQIFDTSDSFGMVGRITSGPHRWVLQEVTSSPDITPEGTTKLKMSRFLCHSLGNSGVFAKELLTIYLSSASTVRRRSPTVTESLRK